MISIGALYNIYFSLREILAQSSDKISPPKPKILATSLETMSSPLGDELVDKLMLQIFRPIKFDVGYYILEYK